EGCEIAINLDGGGSVQTMWSGEVIHPSSDSSGERAAMTYIGISSPPANEYDSGDVALPVASGISSVVPGTPPLVVRQRGSEISLKFAAGGSFPVDSWVQVTSSPVPDRYLGENPSYMRGV